MNSFNGLTYREWLKINDFELIPPKMIDGYELTIISDKNSICFHSWKQYQGFTENYDYCTKCDLKK